MNIYIYVMQSKRARKSSKVREKRSQKVRLQSFGKRDGRQLP